MAFTMTFESYATFDGFREFLLPKIEGRAKAAKEAKGG
jgi:hypothetical protein